MVTIDLVLLKVVLLFLFFLGIFLGFILGLNNPNRKSFKNDGGKRKWKTKTKKTKTKNLRT